MATIGNINVGMILDASGFASGLGVAGSELRGFAGEMASLGSAAKGLAAGFGVLKFAAFSIETAKAAAHVQESINSLSISFGNQAGDAENFARQTARDYSIGLGSILDAENRLGSIFQGAGFQTDAITKYSQDITRAAVDMSRFKDVGFDVALEKIQAGIAGEAEPLRAFGILMSEDATKAFAYARGIAAAGEELTDLQKIQARVEFILNKTAPAFGTAAREAEGYAAKLESVGGAWENFKISIGNATAPIVAPAAGLLAERLGQWGEVIDGITGKTPKLKTLTQALDELHVAYKKSMEPIRRTGPMMMTGADLNNFAQIAGSIGVGGNGLTGVMSAELGRLAKANAPAKGPGMMTKADAQNFAAILGAGPMFGNPLGGLTGVIGAEANRIATKRGPTATSFAGAARAGSLDAASTILRSRYGGTKDPVAENTKKTADGVGGLGRKFDALTDKLYQLAATKPQPIEIK